MSDLGQLLYLLFREKLRYRPAEDTGIITASDARRFVGIQLLYGSLIVTNDVELVCFDLGLTPEQKAWCQEQTNLQLQEPQVLPWPKTKPMWQTWNKPFFMDESPFRKTIWIDGDCFVTESLLPLYKFLENGPVFTPDAVSSCNDDLYKFLPIPGIYKEPKPYINAGVIAFDLDRSIDRQILDKWKEIILQISENQDLENCIIHQDQGALRWVVHALKAQNYIIDTKYLNFLFPHHRPCSPEKFLLGCKQMNGTINHFVAGVKKPWENWGPIIPLKFDHLDLHLSQDPPEPDPLSDKLNIFVLHNDPKFLNQIYDRPYLTKVNLGNLNVGQFQVNELCENRIYLSNLIKTPHEYIGFASARWNWKYKGILHLEDMNLLRNQLRPDTVYIAEETPVDWKRHSESSHPGISKFIQELEDLTGLTAHGRSFWANNFICHRKVFEDFLRFWRKVFYHIHNKYGLNFDFNIGWGNSDVKPAYLLERITVLYFANRKDLKLKVLNANEIVSHYSMS